MTRVLFVAEAGDSSCAEARAHIPALGLRQIGWDADVCSVVFENVDGKLYGYSHVEEKQLPCPSIVVVRHTQGPDGEEWDSVNMYQQARKKGQRIFFDMDDDMWNLPEWNPASKWVTPEVTATVMRNIDACDGLLVSTDALAEEALKHLDIPVYVTPNGVVPHFYTPRTDERTPIRLAWFGATDYRVKDLELVAESLRKTLEGRYGEVELWHVGWMPNQPSVRDVLGSDFPVEIVEYPWMPLHLLPQIIPMIDVAILPQINHPFSEARSNWFGLRLCAAGIPWAATATHEYEKLWKQGAGYPVYDEQWDKGISVLVDPAYKEARTDIRIAGFRVAQNHDPVHTARNYAKVFGD